MKSGSPPSPVSSATIGVSLWPRCSAERHLEPRSRITVRISRITERVSSSVSHEASPAHAAPSRPSSSAPRKRRARCLRLREGVS